MIEETRHHDLISLNIYTAVTCAMVCIMLEILPVEARDASIGSWQDRCVDSRHVWHQLPGGVHLVGRDLDKLARRLQSQLFAFIQYIFSVRRLVADYTGVTALVVHN